MKRPTNKQISEVMRALAQRPRTMSPAAIEQRRAAGRRSGVARSKNPARRTPPGGREVLAQSKAPKKGTARERAIERARKAILNWRWRNPKQI